VTGDAAGRPLDLQIRYHNILIFIGLQGSLVLFRGAISSRAATAVAAVSRRAAAAAVAGFGRGGVGGGVVGAGREQLPPGCGWGWGWG